MKQILGNPTPREFVMVCLLAFSILLSLASLGVATTHSGPQGERGIQGIPGKPGITGPAGATGPAGPVFSGKQDCTIVDTVYGNGEFSPPTSYTFYCEVHK